MGKTKLKALLDSNPKAKRDRKLIRQALKDINSLRESGVAGDGYSLVPPYGGKGYLALEDVDEDLKKSA